MQRDAVPQGFGRQRLRLHAVRLSLPHARVRPHQRAGRFRLRRDRHRNSAVGPVGLDRPASLSGQARSGPREIETVGGGGHRLCDARRLPGGARRDGLQFPRRHDGHGRGRTHHQSPGRGAAAAFAVHRLYCERRRAHGRGYARIDADGQDHASRRALHVRRQPVRHGVDRSDDRRRVGVLRLRVGHHHRRSPCVHRLRRTSRHRTDDPPKASR